MTSANFVSLATARQQHRVHFVYNSRVIEEIYYPEC